MVVTTDMLLDKAIELFREHGYKTVSIDMICNEFGITKGSFYHHFHTKDELLSRWFQKLIDEMDDQLTLDHSLSPAGQLFRNYMKWAQLLESMGPELLHESLNSVNTQLSEEKSGPTPVSIHAMSMSPRLTLDLIRLSQEQGLISDQYTPEQLLIMCTYAVTGLCVNWYIERDRIDFHKEILQILRMVYGETFGQ